MKILIYALNLTKKVNQFYFISKIYNVFFVVIVILWLLYLESGLLFVAYLTIDNLVRPGILVDYYFLVRFQYLVRLLSLCWITGGHKNHPPIKELLPATGAHTP